jgi:hypothetical protein
VVPTREIDPADLKNPGLYINRELSWLAFNERVLEQARDTAHPLLERVKFLGITGRNLDEFFMIRVANHAEEAAGRHRRHRARRLQHRAAARGDAGRGQAQTAGPGHGVGRAAARCSTAQRISLLETISGRLPSASI